MGDWTTRHVITSFIAGLFVTVVLVAGIGGCVYDRDRDRGRDAEKRAVVEQCIRDQARSAVDCRVAVYGGVYR